MSGLTQMETMCNNEDDFPFDPSQVTDSDGDGFGDNPLGNGADRFPNDSSQWLDIDGDGYGDNPNGTDPDAFITDPTQWSDTDGDGYGDNPVGRLADSRVIQHNGKTTMEMVWVITKVEIIPIHHYLISIMMVTDSIDILPKYASPI